MEYVPLQTVFGDLLQVLVVADYSQIELRLLAHMTACRSMIDKFQRGGDFHSEVRPDAASRGSLRLWSSVRALPWRQRNVTGRQISSYR